MWLGESLLSANLSLQPSRSEQSVLDHVSVGVIDLDRSRRFYDAALRPLGLVRIVDFGKDRGSDYGAAPGSLGVEFTITRKAKSKLQFLARICVFVLPIAR